MARSAQALRVLALLPIAFASLWLLADEGVAEKMFMAAPKVRPPAEVAPLSGEMAPVDRPKTTQIKFTLEKIKIDRTRSLDDDTLYADMDVFLFGAGGGGHNFKKLGDRGPGTVTLNLSAQISYDGKGPRTFAYTVVNFGKGDAKVAAFFRDEIAGTWLERFGNIVFADCDGTVAARSRSLNQAQLAQIVSGATMRETDVNNGTDSPTGCGANSRYSVTWSISPVH